LAKHTDRKAKELAQGRVSLAKPGYTWLLGLCSICAA